MTQRSFNQEEEEGKKVALRVSSLPDREKKSFLESFIKYLDIKSLAYIEGTKVPKLIARVVAKEEGVVDLSDDDDDSDAPPLIDDMKTRASAKRVTRKKSNDSQEKKTNKRQKLLNSDSDIDESTEEDVVSEMSDGSAYASDDGGSEEVKKRGPGRPSKKLNGDSSKSCPSTSTNPRTTRSQALNGKGSNSPGPKCSKVETDDETDGDDKKKISRKITTDEDNTKKKIETDEDDKKKIKKRGDPSSDDDKKKKPIEIDSTDEDEKKKIKKEEKVSSDEDDRKKIKKNESSDDEEIKISTKRRNRSTDNLKKKRGEIVSTDEDDKKKRKKKGSSSTDEDDEESESASTDEDDRKTRKKRGRDKKGRGKRGKAQAKKGRKRRRNKNVAILSSGEEQSDSEVTDEEPNLDFDSEDEAAYERLRKKGTRKLITEDKLNIKTKQASTAERDRIARLKEKQALYNKIIETKANTKKKGVTRVILDIDEKKEEVIVEVIPDLAKELKDHQIEGVKFMYNCLIESAQRLKKEPGSGCILAHSMGLGKTLQTITFIYTCLTSKAIKPHIKTALVVCPVNTCKNWANEFNLWLFEKGLSSFKVHDFSMYKSQNERRNILEEFISDGGVMIIGCTIYQKLVLDAMNAADKSNKKVSDSKLFVTVRKCLVNPGPNLVIVDEGHLLKNDKSNLNRALSCIKTRRRAILTGTPLQNNLNEYHCMVSFVKPNLLGTKKEFTNRFVNPITTGQTADSTPTQVTVMKKRTHILHKLLDGCVHRCDYNVLVPYLQPKLEYVLKIKSSEPQSSIYRHYLDHFTKASAVAGTEQSKGRHTLFNDCQVFRLICSHPFLLEVKEDKRHQKNWILDDEETSAQSTPSDVTDDEDEGGKSYKSKPKKRVTRAKKDEVDEPDSPEVVLPNDPTWFKQYLGKEPKLLDHSGKFLLLFEFLRKCEKIGDKLVVFSQSLDTLDLIEDYLAEIDEENRIRPIKDGLRNTWADGQDYLRIDGASSVDKRKKMIDKFNDPDNLRSRLFLLSTKAGSLGINLIGANRCIIFDASWNPTHDVQAIFRIYRFGQKKPIYVYRFVSKGTMEERIYDRQIIKESLSRRVVDEQQIMRHFKENELAELYKFEPEGDGEILKLPDDRMLADIIHEDGTKDLILGYHTHDSLLEDRPDENLAPEELENAWKEYEIEKDFEARAEKRREEARAQMEQNMRAQQEIQAQNAVNFNMMANEMMRTYSAAYPSTSYQPNGPLQSQIMPLPALLQLTNVKLEDLAQVVYSNSAKSPGEWTEEAILSETEKSAKLILQSVEVYLNAGPPDPMTGAKLRAMYERLGKILIECGVRKSDLVRQQRIQAQEAALMRANAAVAAEAAKRRSVAARVAQIERELDIPD